MFTLRPLSLRRLALNGACAILALTALAGNGNAAPQSAADLASMMDGKALVAAAPDLAAIKNTKTKKLDANLAFLSLATDQGKNLTLAAPASSVFIANPDVADVQVLSPTSLMVFGKKTGQTTLIASDNAGTILMKKTVVVTQDLADLRTALRAILPHGKITVEAVPNGIVLAGEAKDASQVEDARRVAMRYISKEGEVINRVKVKGGNQIHIRVRFAEVSREVDKRLGVNWENSFKFGGFTLGMGTGADVVASGLFQRPVNESDVNGIFAGNYTGRRMNLNGMIDALSKDGLVTILAEPNLTAMSGEPAAFLAGGEFPVPVPNGDNITIEWKQYGVSLTFTPTLLGESRINLHVRPEVSQLSDTGAVTLSNIRVPSLSTRRAETTVELASGQSFAIGGLLNNNQTQSIEKYPFLGDMPILGPLFRSTRFKNDQSELVIIITPYVVKPASEESLGLPMDHRVPPSDTERLGKMLLSSENSQGRPISGTARAVEDEATSQPAAPQAAPLPRVIRGEPTAAAKTPSAEMPAQFPAPVPAFVPPPHASMTPAPVASPVGTPRLSLPSAPAPSVAPSPVTPSPIPTTTPRAVVPSSVIPKPAVPFGSGGFILE